MLTKPLTLSAPHFGTQYDIENEDWTLDSSPPQEIKGYAMGVVTGFAIKQDNGQIKEWG